MTAACLLKVHNKKPVIISMKHTDTHLLAFVCACMCVRVCVHACVRACVCACVCVCVHT